MVSRIIMSLMPLNSIDGSNGMVVTICQHMEAMVEPRISIKVSEIDSVVGFRRVAAV